MDCSGLLAKHPEAADVIDFLGNASA